MRNIISFLVLFLFTTLAYAQNKSLGVGTAAPNPNAALHVESPTNNQGFIMPRLSTIQRTGMSSLLTASDQGLMLYDTDLKTIYIWDGTAWKSTAQAAGGAKLSFPSKDSLTIDPGPNAPLFHIINNAVTPANPRLIQLDNLQTDGGTTLRVHSNSHWAPAGFFRTQHDTASAATLQVITNSNRITPPGQLAPVAVLGLTNGTGALAGAFRIVNASNDKPGLLAETNGTGPALSARNNGASDGFAGLFYNDLSSNTYPAIQAGTQGPGTGVRVMQDATSIGGGMDVYMQNITSTAVGLNVDQQGLGGAGNFVVNNTSNTTAALNAETNGQSYGIRGFSTGTNNAGYFEINNASSAASALAAVTDSNTGRAFTAINFGTGQAGGFTINNPASTNRVLFVSTNGTGRAGHFQLSNAAAIDNAALYATTTSTGSNSSAFRAEHNGTSGYSGIFQNINAANNSPSLFASTASNGAAFHADTDQGGNAVEGIVYGTGTGTAGFFDISNAASSASVVSATTNGSGNAVAAINNGTGFAMYARALGNTDAIYAVKQVGDGGGSAGNFQNQEPGNGASTLFAMTNAEPGTAIGAINSANGNAFAIFTGGMRLSTSTISTSGPLNITTRAAAYLFDGSASGTYTFDPSVTLNEGDTFYFYNSTASGITLTSSPNISIPSNAGKTVIYLGGQLRGL